MSFDQDPYESVTISCSDFAEMCDEIKRLTAQKDDLICVLDKAATVFAAYETHHAELGASYKATTNGCYKKMCLEAISRARGQL